MILQKQVFSAISANFFNRRNAKYRPCIGHVYTVGAKGEYKKRRFSMQDAETIFHVTGTTGILCS